MKKCQAAIKNNSKDDRETIFVSSGTILSKESEEHIIAGIFCESHKIGYLEVKASLLLNKISSSAMARSSISIIPFHYNVNYVRNI